MATLNANYHNAHFVTDESQAKSPFDFIFGPQEQTAEVKAIFEQMAIDQLMDRQRSLEAFQKSQCASPPKDSQKLLQG